MDDRLRTDGQTDGTSDLKDAPVKRILQTFYTYTTKSERWNANSDVDSLNYINILRCFYESVKRLSNCVRSQSLREMVVNVNFIVR
jgi:hypothetical protein